MLGEVLLEGFAVEQFHHQVGLALLFADVVDDADIGVGQGGRSPGLAQKSLVGEVYREWGVPAGDGLAGASAARKLSEMSLMATSRSSRESSAR